MNKHWEQFVEEISWFVEPGQTAEVGVSLPSGSWTPVSGKFENLFPDCYRILRTAIVTPVAVAGVRYQLFTWPRADGFDCSWLSPVPSLNPPRSLHADHQVLLASFGGIVERGNEPSWWVLNHNDVLTEHVARGDATFIRGDARFEMDNIEIPIELEQFYAIAYEANGNVTLCHRQSGEVVLYAHDHAFRHVEPYPGCPEDTLYRLPEAPDFGPWVNTVARQWQRWIEAVA